MGAYNANIEDKIKALTSSAPEKESDKFYDNLKEAYVLANTHFNYNNLDSVEDSFNRLNAKLSAYRLIIEAYQHHTPEISEEEILKKKMELLCQI